MVPELVIVAPDLIVRVDPEAILSLTPDVMFSVPEAMVSPVLAERFRVLPEFMLNVPLPENDPE